jgi:hypothetical protein
MSTPTTPTMPTPVWERVAPDMYRIVGSDIRVVADHPRVYPKVGWRVVVNGAATLDTATTLRDAKQLAEARWHPTFRLGDLEVSVDPAENTVMISFAGQGLALVVIPAMGAAGEDAHYWIDGSPEVGIEPIPPTRYVIAGWPDGEDFARLLVGELGVGPEGARAAAVATAAAAATARAAAQFQSDHS